VRSVGHRREHALPLALLVVFGMLWVALAVAPVDRETWVLENLLLVLFVAALVAGYRRFHFSRAAYVLMFVFLCLHAVGGHYTYSLVPYDDWARGLTGSTVNEQFGWTRNHYDRLLHFLFGFLLAGPARELLLEITGVRRGWSYFLAIVLIMASSSLYELIEWAAAVVFGGELGMHYLGTQGDEWDGQRDMALAALGAVLVMSLAAVRAVLMRWMRSGADMRR
jgi:putative membrane protein